MLTDDMPCKDIRLFVQSLTVKVQKRVGAIILVAVLGILLGAEAIEMPSQNAPCLESAQSFSQGLSPEYKDESLSNCNSSSTDSRSKSGADTCHAGQAHFGHSSFPTSLSYIKYGASSSSLEAPQLIQHAIEAPDLEGPRRPPRLS